MAGYPEDPSDMHDYLQDQREHRLYLERACDPGWNNHENEPGEEPMGYIDLAMRTNSNVTGQNPAVSPDLLHATLGMCDEHFEYHSAKSWAHACEELGDLCWFVALASHDLRVDPFARAEEFLDNNPEAPVLAAALAEFVSHVKRSYAYGKELNIARLFYLLRAMAARIALISESKSDRTFDELLEANIAKLAARYPEKFETDLALNRDLRSEGRALRGVLL